MRQVTRKKYREFLRGSSVMLFDEPTEESALRSVYEWVDATNTAHARVVYIYAAAEDSEAFDTIYEIED